MSESSNELQFSLFKNAMDNLPIRRHLTWPQLVEFIEAPRPTPKAETLEAAKRLMPAISPATFRPGTTRGVANVEALHLLFFDFDNSVLNPTADPATGRSKRVKEMIQSPVHSEEVDLHLASAGIDHLIYNTWSNTRNWPHFRLVIPLPRPVLPEKWDATTSWLIQRLGLGQFMRGVDQPVLKDTARLYFLPGGPNAR